MMLLGQTSLFNDFSDNPAGFRPNSSYQESAEEARKRNMLLPERNCLLAHRFYYYDMIKQYKSEKCLEELAKEFFLSERRLIDLIYEIGTTINEVRQNRPGISELKSKFPWMNWNM